MVFTVYYAVSAKYRKCAPQPRVMRPSFPPTGRRLCRKPTNWSSASESGEAGTYLYPLLPLGNKSRNIGKNAPIWGQNRYMLIAITQKIGLP